MLRHHRLCGPGKQTCGLQERCCEVLRNTGGKTTCSNGNCMQALIAGVNRIIEASSENVRASSAVVKCSVIFVETKTTNPALAAVAAAAPIVPPRRMVLGAVRDRPRTDPRGGWHG